MICFECGRRLQQAFTRKTLEGVERIVGGNPVKMHKGCAEQWDRENRRVTARDTTNECGATYVDGRELATPQGEVVKLLRPRRGGA